MNFNKPIQDIIRQRYSCRSFMDRPVEKGALQQLNDFLAAAQSAPFGAPARFELVAATEEQRKQLRGLGTYGFIRGNPTFIAGALGEGDKNLEDYGYMLERAVLHATQLELGTCWLGGTFNKSGFGRKIKVKNNELIPAVIALGHPIEVDRRDDMIRRSIGASQRLPWDELFFDHSPDTPLAREAAENYAEPLEMVRLGPSASNKQPWRVLREANAWHFYLRRTPGYGKNFISRILAVDDMQRVDLGIAFCHFELTARELGLKGNWVKSTPAVQRTPAFGEYVASWVGEA